MREGQGEREREEEEEERGVPLLVGGTREVTEVELRLRCFCVEINLALSSLCL